ncbi:MAG: DUF2085 domain-containing protein [Mycoplasmatales bacterium]
MIKFIYKYLPIICGCHGKTSRSFIYNSRKFPVCARCTGILIGLPIGFIVSFFYLPNNFMIFLLILPLIIDGFLQLLTSYESNNIRRLITGVLFGYSIHIILVKLAIFSIQFYK